MAQLRLAYLAETSSSVFACVTIPGKGFEKAFARRGTARWTVHAQRLEQPNAMAQDPDAKIPIKF